MFPHFLFLSRPWYGNDNISIVNEGKVILIIAFHFSGSLKCGCTCSECCDPAPCVGGEGLGREIVDGINVCDGNKIFSGAIITIGLAILIDYLLGLL